MTVCATSSGSPARKILLDAVLIAAALVVTAAFPAGKGPVAVFAAPWSADAAEIVAQAGGRLVAVGRSSRIIIAVSADDDFVSRLYRAGALLVTDPRYAVGCNAESIQGDVR
jgi:hypothetical protein